MCRKNGVKPEGNIFLRSADSVSEIIDVCKNNYKIHVRECHDGDIIEIDTFNELKQIDKSYDCYKKVRK